MRTNRFLTISLAAISLLLSVTTSPNARSLFEKSKNGNVRFLGKPAAETPFVMAFDHRVGRMHITVTNEGHFGNGFLDQTIGVDGEVLPSCEYPINSNIDYLFSGAFWIGAIVGRDTLVSVGADGWQPTQEMFPGSFEAQTATGEIMRQRSISDPQSPEFALAKSEQDIIAVYYDTLTQGLDQDPIDSRPHRPLNIKIEQTSYSWSYSYAEDFVLFDYRITNIHGRNILENVYMGIYVDGDVGHISTRSTDGFLDDICGFKLDVEQLNFRNSECSFRDTIRIAWISDNDGDNSAQPATADKLQYDQSLDPVAVTGTRVVRTPSDSLKFSFNWWISSGNASTDFGPRKAGVEGDPFRDFGGFLGTPEGDKNKYYIMSHEEFDYDQLYSATDQSDAGWLPPGQQGQDFANGFDTRYLLSFGPFTIFPGETLPITFAYVAGDNFHTNPQNMNDLFNPFQPDAYYNSLDFSDFGVNAQWASWIYDNPGVDSDTDGYFGKFRLCADSSTLDTAFDTFYNDDSTIIDSIVMGETFFAVADTLFYEGDGVPDFRGASPPPAPDVRVKPSPGELTVRWNGLRSETTPDAFSSVLDFEGYRVYLGFGNRTDDMVLQTSFDRENYTRFYFNLNGNLWQIAGPPQTLAEIRAIYANNNSNYDPLDNGIDNPIRIGDSLFYFITQDWNQDNLDDPNEIHKRFPNAPYPHTLILDSAFTTDTFLVNPSSGDTTWYNGGELTVDGNNFKHFEYEYTLRNLLASQLHYVSVTAFDFGAPESGLDALESSLLFNVVAEYPQNTFEAIAANDLKVVVYPNPYRIDGNYRAQGYEGRIKNDLPDERVRAINFTNLPPVCTIRIFTIDGDMVREINHNTAPGDPRSMHEPWDLVTRNVQMVVSGIYYWTVESPDGDTQVGKLVVIM